MPCDCVDSTFVGRFLFCIHLQITTDLSNASMCSVVNVQYSIAKRSIMNTYNLSTWLKDGERQFTSAEARRLFGISNRGTWNDYLESIGLSPGFTKPVLRMTDLVWVAIARAWVKAGSKKRTHDVFRFLRSQKKWKSDNFLDYLGIDFLTITQELRSKING